VQPLLQWKNNKHTYSDFVFVALDSLHAKRMRHTMSPVACPAVQQFSTLSYKRHDFRENVIEHKMCVLILSITFVSKISHSNKNPGRY
jgi:hypothetical protein